MRNQSDFDSSSPGARLPVHTSEAVNTFVAEILSVYVAARPATVAKHNAEMETVRANNPKEGDFHFQGNDWTG